MKLSDKTHALLRRYRNSQVALSTCLHAPKREQLRKAAEVHRIKLFNHIIEMEKELNRLRAAGAEKARVKDRGYPF
jgi:hypothetical protein